MKHWQFGKNLHKPDLPYLIRLFRRADEERGKPLVKSRGSVVKRAKLIAYLRRKGKTEDEILATASANDPIPDYITLEYPYANQPSQDMHVIRQQSDVSPLTIATFSGATAPSDSPSHKSTRLSTPISSHGTPYEQFSVPNFPSQRQPLDLSLQQSPTRPSLSQGPGMPLSLLSQSDVRGNCEASLPWHELDECESYNSVINQMLRPDTPPDTRWNQSNMFKIISGARQVPSQHLIRGLNNQSEGWTDAVAEMDILHYAEDLPHQFLLRFFRGHMMQNQGSKKDAADSFYHAYGILKTMIANRHPRCLVTLNVMLSVLEAHGQKDLAGEFLSNVLVFSQVNGVDNAVAATTEFMVNVATRRLKLVEVEVNHLESIYELLRTEFGSESSSALVALYHVAWRRATSNDHRAASLQTLTGLVHSATNILGSSHFFTIACMTTRARVVFRMGSHEESIRLMNQALEMIDLKYEPSHPYRLEALHRLAIFLVDADRPADAVGILRDVVVKRAKVIGRHNILTTRSLELLQEAWSGAGRDIAVDDLVMEMLPVSSVNYTRVNSSWTAYLPMSPPKQTLPTWL